MKTHDIAKILRALANVLEQGPNTPIESAVMTAKDSAINKTQIAVSLDTLIELSSIDKAKWISFINEMGYKLDLRPRDGSRDILGKLMNYLESNPGARENLKIKATAKSSEASPELLRALSSLLKG